MKTGKILVTGATGTIGNLLVAELLKAGADLRAMVRDLAKGQELRDHGVETVAGDFERPETLGPALSGVSQVFLLSVPGPAMVGHEGTMLAAVRQSEPVPHIVKLSAIGASPDARFRFGSLHGEAEQVIERSGVPFTFLRPNGFMQNLFGSVASIREQGSIFAPLGDARVSIIDARDIAAVAAKALTEDGHTGRVYELTGPEALSYTDVTRLLSPHIGKEIHYVDVPPAVARTSMIQSGMSEWLTDGLLELFAFYREGAAAAVANTVKDVTGTAPRTFDQFAQEFAGAFKG